MCINNKYTCTNCVSLGELTLVTDVMKQGQGITENAGGDLEGMRSIVIYSLKIGSQFTASYITQLKLITLTQCVDVVVVCSTAKQVVVPDELLMELAELRVAFAMLVHNYENELNNNHEAQVKFVNFLPRLLSRGCDQNFQSSFNRLIDEEVSLFNVCYLKKICCIFPENIR